MGACPANNKHWECKKIPQYEMICMTTKQTLKYGTVKLIVTNSNVKLIDFRFKRLNIFFWVSAYMELKNKGKF